MHEVGGSNSGRGMSVWGALIEDGDDLGQVSPYSDIFFSRTYFINKLHTFKSNACSVLSKKINKISKLI